MYTYLVCSKGVQYQVQALEHRDAARLCGLLAGGETLWVDGPVDERAPKRATIHFTATTHRPPHLRQGLTYRYG